MKKAIFGLGNPGQKYKNTPHNLGFEVVSLFRKKEEFPSFKIAPRWYSRVSRGETDKESLILVKPQTYMNHSGQAVRAIKKDKDLELSNIWVIYDDVDLPLGKIRVSRGGRAAGHNGIKSIIKNVGGKDFVRFRLGIKVDNIDDLAKHVLRPFTQKEKKTAHEMVETAVKALQLATEKGIEAAQQKFN